MSGHRIDRTTEDIKRELTDIFKSVKDPRVADCFISIIRVEVTNDLSYCTVYFSVICYRLYQKRTWSQTSFASYSGAYL